MLLAASLALASQTRSLLAFQLLFGVGVGGATAAIFAPMMACVTGWFDTHRSLAVSLVSAGMGMAPMTMSPLAAWLITTHDWRASLLILSGVAAALMIPVAFLVRRPPEAPKVAAVLVADDEEADYTLAQAVRSPQFILLLLTNFLCCATHSGPIIHTVSYAVTCGIPMIAAVSIYSVEGLAGLAGRGGFGLFGDRFGAQPSSTSTWLLSLAPGAQCKEAADLSRMLAEPAALCPSDSASQLSTDLERCISMGITYITISHRPTLKA